MELRIFIKKRLTSLAILLLSVGMAHAVDPVTFTLWENGAPTLNGLKADGENNSNLDWVTGVTNSTVTVYPADNPNGTTLLMCPGGAYFGLATMHEGSDLAQPLNDKGVTLAVLKYRLPNGHSEVPADDVWRAVEVLNQNADKFGIDVNKIGIGGASAGGHLATTVATHPKEGMNPFAFQMLVYPVVTMKEGTHGGSRENLLGKTPSDAQLDYYSNELHVTPSTPQAFIVVSANDDIVPVENSLNYFEALKANKVPVYMHVFPTGGHGWLCRKNFKYNSQAVDEIVDWVSNLKFEK